MFEEIALSRYSHVMTTEKKVTLPYMSGQWPEYRNFGRTYGRDPDRQAQALYFLVGLHQSMEHYVGSNPEMAKLNLGALAVVTTFFIEHYPEAMQEVAERDSDCGFGSLPYERDERLPEFIGRILEKLPEKQ